MERSHPKQCVINFTWLRNKRRGKKRGSLFEVTLDKDRCGWVPERNTKLFLFEKLNIMFSLYFYRFHFIQCRGRQNKSMSGWSHTLSDWNPVMVSFQHVSFRRPKFKLFSHNPNNPTQLPTPANQVENADSFCTYNFYIRWISVSVLFFFSH